MTTIADLTTQIRSARWAAGAAGAAGYGSAQADCASIPGFAGVLIQYVAPLREWFDDLLGSPGEVGAFASRWEDAERTLRGILHVLAGAERSLADLDGRTVRALRARHADLRELTEDAMQWSGATASAVRLVSQIIESTRVLICDFLGRLGRLAADLFTFSLNPLSKLDDIRRFADSAAELIAVGGALVKNLVSAVATLAQLLHRLVPLIADALQQLRGIYADMLPFLGSLHGGPIGLVAGNVLHDFLDTDVPIAEIDPADLTGERRLAWERAHEVTSLNSLEDLIRVNSTTDAMGGEDSTVIDIKRVLAADGTTHWVISLPSTQAWELFGASGAMNDRDSNIALMLDNPLLRTQYERAVLQAMSDAGVPPGADVVLTGFSQGGIMAVNLAGDPSFPYNPIGVVTNGSPIDGFRVPAQIPVYAFQHASDIVPMVDGGVVGVPGVRGPLPLPVPGTGVTVLPANVHQITLPDPPGQHLFGAHGNELYADSVARWEQRYHADTAGADPWGVGGLGGEVIDHQVYSGVEH